MLNARLEIPNREGRRDWGRDDLRTALRMIGDVRAATLQAVADAAVDSHMVVRGLSG